MLKPIFYQHIKKTLVTGVFALFPIALTLWVVVGLFQLVDHWLQPLISVIYGQKLPGLGFVITLFLVYLLGLVANNVMGHRLLQIWERLIRQIPFVKGLYDGIKQLSDTMSPASKNQFREVFLVQFPHTQAFALGFGTQSIVVLDKNSQQPITYRYVFVPTTPNPTSGYLLILKESDLKPLPMSVEEGLKMVISGGVVGPNLSAALG